MKKLFLILFLLPCFVNAQDIKEVWFTQNGQMVSSLCYGQQGYQLNVKGVNCDKWEIVLPNYMRFNGDRGINTNAQIQQQIIINDGSISAIITQVQFKHNKSKKLITFHLDQRAYPPVFVGYHCPK